MAEDGSGLLHAGYAAVDVIPRVDTAALAAGVSAAVKAGIAEIGAATDTQVGARLAAAGTAASGVATAFKPASKAAAEFGAIALAAAVDVDHGMHILEQRTGATGDQLKSLETIATNTARATGAGFAQIGADEANLTQRIGAQGQVLQQLTTQYENLRYVQGEQAASIGETSAALAQFQVQPEKAGKALDEMFVASQRAGVGTNALAGDLVANGAVLRTLNLGYTESLALLASLEKGGIPVQQTLVGLRRALAEAAKEGKPANEFLAETVQHLHDLAAVDPGAALVKANEIFGKRGGTTVLDAIRQGRLDASDMTAALANSEGAINANAKATESFSRELGQVRNEIELSLKPLGDSVLPEVTGGLHAVAAVAGTIGGALHDTGLDSVLGGAVVATAAAAGFLKLGGAIASMAASRQQAFALLQAHATALAAETGLTEAATAAQAELATATIATAAAETDLDAAIAVYGAESAAATAASLALAEAMSVEAGAAGAAAAADLELATAETAVASAGAVAAAAVSTIVAAVAAAVGGFALGTAGMHALESAINGPKVNADKLDASLKELNSTGSYTGELAARYQNLGKAIHDVADDSTFSRMNRDKAKDELSKLDQALANVVSSGHGKDLANDLQRIADASGVTVEEVLRSISPYGQLADATHKAAVAAEDKAKADGFLTAADEELATAIGKVNTSLLAVPSADLALQSSHLSTQQATEALAASQAKLDHLMHGYPATSQEAISAEQSYQSALDSARNARDGVAAAERGLNDVRRQGVEEEHRLTEAVESARNALLDKQGSVISAQDALNKAITHGADHHEIEALQRALEKAKRDETTGVEHLTDAQKALADEPRKRAEAEARASEQIAKAMASSQKATEALAKAAHDLDVILHGRPATDQQVVAAQEDVRSKSIAVQNAALGEAAATVKADEAAAKHADTLYNTTTPALLGEVDALRKIEEKSPQTKAALDPLIDSLLKLVWIRTTLDPTGRGILGDPKNPFIVPPATAPAPGATNPGSGVVGPGDPVRGPTGPGVVPASYPGTPAPTVVTAGISTTTLENHMADAVRALNLLVLLGGRRPGTVISTTGVDTVAQAALTAGVRL